MKIEFLKHFLIPNPCAFIGYYIVLAETKEKALDMALRRIFKDYPVADFEHPKMSDVQEIVFDEDYIFDELRLLE